jgi:hypothetical protein
LLQTAAGAEADSFALGVWPDLRTAGGFRQIYSLWVNYIAQLVWSCNINAAQQVRGGTDCDYNGELASSSSSSSSSGGGQRGWDIPWQTPDAVGAGTGSNEAQEDAAVANAQQ